MGGPLAPSPQCEVLRLWRDPPLAAGKADRPQCGRGRALSATMCFRRWYDTIVRLMETSIWRGAGRT
jgi:hypothetical protein